MLSNNLRAVLGYRLAVIGWLLLMAVGAFAAGIEPTDAPKPGLYSIDASGTDIRNVLEALARQSGTNLVISPEVKGPITAKLKQMPVESLLNSLSAAQGFEWTETNGAYIISPKDKTKPEVAPPPTPENETLIWRVRHIKGSQLVTLINSMFPDLKAAVGPSGVSPKLEDPISSAGETTGSGSTGSGGSSSSSSSSSSGDDDKALTVVLYGQPTQVARAKALLEKIDVPSPQIAIEVSITEINSSASKELGVNWSWTDIALKEGDSSGIKFGKFSKEAMTFTGTLTALYSNGSAHLLAQPNMYVIDGGYADILIGDRILFPKLVGYTQFGTPMYDKDEERVGIYLQVAPRVTDDDHVILSLYPQVSLVTSYLKTQAGDYPQISTREARTTVSVKSGHTLAIGGLIRDNEVRNADKIPLLGDLPILGQFFKHSKTTKDRTEIVIFLTPKILAPGD